MTRLKAILENASRGRYKRDMAIAIRDAARNSIGSRMPAKSLELQHTIRLIRELDAEIAEIEGQIQSFMEELDSPITTIPGLGFRMAAMILAEVGDFSRFDSPDKLLAYAGMSPSTYQSGQLRNCYPHMEKRGSRYLRYALYNAAKYVCYPDVVLVFVTDYIEYAPAGYRVDAFRYLLKSRLELELSDALDEIVDKLYVGQATIQVKSRSEDVPLQLKDIVYIEGTGRRRVLVHLAGVEAPMECSGKLTEFEDALKSDGFLRLQRSFLANMRHIKKISGYTAYLDDGTELKVSDRNYNALRNTFLAWKGRHI